MIFDPTITTADVLVALGYVGSLGWFAIKQRDNIRELSKQASASIAALQSECDHKAALSGQRLNFIERKISDDAQRNESHWTEVKQALADIQNNVAAALTRIFDKLDNKADKPNA